MAKAAQAAKPNASPEDKAACFTEYSSLRADVARLGQRIAATLDRYEKMGVDAKAIKHAYAQSQKDPHEVAAQERKNAEYLRIFNIIEVEEDGQASILPGLTIVKPTGRAADDLAKARAHADGYNTGLAGGKLDACRLPQGSEPFVSWRDGWEDGRADRLARHPEKAKVVQADARRGRKKRGEAAAPETDPAPEGQTDIEDVTGQPAAEPVSFH